MVPQPPFHSVTEELLYNIYLMLQGNPSAFDTLEKLNSILVDAELMSADEIKKAIKKLKGRVPVKGDSLYKLYKMVRSLEYVTPTDLHEAISNVKVKTRTFQFCFYVHWHGHKENVQKGTGYGLARGQDDDEDHGHGHGRWDQDRFVLRGQIASLAEDLTRELSEVKYATRLDGSPEWKMHDNLEELQGWIDEFVSGDGYTGIKYWIKCIPVFKHDGKAGVNVLRYSISIV